MNVDEYDDEGGLSWSQFVGLLMAGSVITMLLFKVAGIADISWMQVFSPLWVVIVLTVLVFISTIVATALIVIIDGIADDIQAWLDSRKKDRDEPND